MAESQINQDLAEARKLLPVITKRYILFRLQTDVKFSSWIYPQKQDDFDSYLKDESSGLDEEQLEDYVRSLYNYSVDMNVEDRWRDRVYAVAFTFAGKQGEEMDALLESALGFLSYSHFNWFIYVKVVEMAAYVVGDDYRQLPIIDKIINVFMERPISATQPPAVEFIANTGGWDEILKTNLSEAPPAATEYHHYQVISVKDNKMVSKKMLPYAGLPDEMVQRAVASATKVCNCLHAQREPPFGRPITVTAVQESVAPHHESLGATGQGPPGTPQPQIAGTSGASAAGSSSASTSAGTGQRSAQCKCKGCNNVVKIPVTFLFRRQCPECAIYWCSETNCDGEFVSLRDPCNVCQARR